MKQSGTQAMEPISETNLSRSDAPAQAASAHAITTEKRKRFFCVLTFQLQKEQSLDGYTHARRSKEPACTHSYFPLLVVKMPRSRMDSAGKSCSGVLSRIASP